MSKKTKKDPPILIIKLDEINIDPYTPLRRTQSKYKVKIEQFINQLLGLDAIKMYNSIMNHNYSTARGYSVEEEIGREIIISAFYQNEIISHSISICTEEFYNYLYELHVASYSGAARSLRYILEMAVEACEFQTDPSRIKFNDLKNIVQSEKGAISFVKYHNLWISFMERYKIYEDSKKLAPTFAEIVNKLNSRQLFKEDLNVNLEIKQFYEKLSDYVHPDYIKIESYLRTNKKPYPIFNEEEFMIMYNYGLAILDLIEFLYIQTTAHYHDKESGKMLLKEYSEGVTIDGRKRNYFMKLPHIKKLSGSISWQFRLKKKKITIRSRTSSMS